MIANSAQILSEKCPCSDSPSHSHLLVGPPWRGLPPARGSWGAAWPGPNREVTVLHFPPGVLP